LRAGEEAACGDTPCHGDLFHIQRRCKGLADTLSRLTADATSQRMTLQALASLDLATRRELFNFVLVELMAREPEDPRRIRTVLVALQNQRDDLLAFAGLLDDKLADVAQAYAISEPRVREACVLHRLPATPLAYW
jgi:hypothetical protein